MARTFSAVLEALGAFNTDALESTEHWTVYKPSYQTPAGSITACYLVLSHNCPGSEATLSNLSRWKALAGRASYTAVVTKGSRLASDLSRTAATFGARDATTSRSLLFDNVIRTLFPDSVEVDESQYFIEPDIGLPGGGTRLALSFLADDLLGVGVPESICADVLVAPAGLGKTTLSRALARRLIVTKRVIPLLVESAQWQNLINLTLPNVLNAALLQLLPEAGRLTNPKLFQLLVQEQLIVPIFDGFDELCSHPNSNYKPATLISELIDLVGDAGARVLVTTRETFWEKSSVGVPLDRVKRLNLQGFSNDQRSRFFGKRLKDPSDRDVANRLAREIGSRLFEGQVDVPAHQAERASGVPLMLELIALYVDGNPNATFAPKSHDSIGPLLEAVCERENERQRLGISADRQMAIFEELFRDFQEDISRDDLSLYVQDSVPNVQPDALERFEHHAFFSPGHDLRARFEPLKVYFVARWLANRLEKSVEDKRVPEVLDRNAEGNTDVFDFLVSRFLMFDSRTVKAAVPHAIKMVQSRSHWEGPTSALFHLAERLAHRQESTRQGRTDRIVKYLGFSTEFNRIAVFGQISGLDLRHVTFASCVFKEVEFHGCSFGDNSRFQRCRFDGRVAFENCDGTGLVSLVDCICSDAAEEEWERQAGRGSKSSVTEAVARDAVREALRKFIGPFGFSSVKDADKGSGRLAKSPCRDTVWDELLRAKILERHLISGVTGGGLNIAKEGNVKHEVRNFLDNAAAGPKLADVISELVKTGRS